MLTKRLILKYCITNQLFKPYNIFFGILTTNYFEQVIILQTDRKKITEDR